MIFNSLKFYQNFLTPMKYAFDTKGLNPFLLGSYFNESVAMDIKKINDNKVLHLIDHGAR